jgi:hypothetical protein
MATGGICDTSGEMRNVYNIFIGKQGIVGVDRRAILK